MTCRCELVSGSSQQTTSILTGNLSFERSYPQVAPQVGPKSAQSRNRMSHMGCMRCMRIGSNHCSSIPAILESGSVICNPNCRSEVPVIAVGSRCLCVINQHSFLPAADERLMLILYDTNLAPLTTCSIHAMVLADIWRFHRVNKFSVVSVLLVLVITLVIIGGGP